MAKRNNLELIELNFEKRPEIAEHFNSNDPVKILSNIESELNCKINLNNSHLFLDEIQVKSELLSVLRWFMEEMPQLPVISAGSLFDFPLKKSYLQYAGWKNILLLSGIYVVFKIYISFRK